MINNKLTCPHCEKDVATVGLRYGSKQWLFVLPILAIGIYPLLSITVFKSKSSALASEDLQISSYETRIEGKELVVTGVITNLTESAWKSVSVEAEFFDESGKYIGEGTDYSGSDIHPNSQENFEVRFRYLPELVLAGKAKTELKIAGGICFN